MRNFWDHPFRTYAIFPKIKRILPPQTHVYVYAELELTSSLIFWNYISLSILYMSRLVCLSNFYIYFSCHVFTGRGTEIIWEVKTTFNTSFFLKIIKNTASAFYFQELKGNKPNKREQPSTIPHLYMCGIGINIKKIQVHIITSFI